MRTESGHTLREREVELDRIRTALAAAQDGQGQLIVVEGPAGIGKSSLLREARSFARANGARCLNARGSELESSFPFGMVRQLLDPVVLAANEDERDALLRGPAGAARSLFDDAEAVGEASPDALYQRLQGLYWLVTNLAARSPLVIAFDDAHWADEASLKFVSFMARRVEELPLLLAVGTRPVSDQGRPVLSALATDAAATVLRPSPLTQQSVDLWVRDVLSEDADAAFVEACHASTSGIPFLVGELLREVASEGLRPTAAEARRVGALTLDGVSTIVELRMASMPAGSAQLARAVAVLGDGTQLATAAALTDLDDVASGEAARALTRAGIMESREGLSFTHPVVRATVYDGMDPGERSAVHAQAAALLRARLATPDQIAAHLLKTDPRGDEEVVEMLTAAAQRATSIGALDTARSYLERALAEPPPGARCATVLTDLGRVEGRLGLTSAIARLEQAMDVADDLEARAGAALELSRILTFAGDGVRGVDVLAPFDEVADELDPELSDLVRLEYLTPGWASADARRRLGDRIRAVADRGEPRTVLDAFSLAALGFNKAAFGESADQAAEYAGRAADSGLLKLDPGGTGGYGLLLAAVALMWSDRYRDAERHMDRMLRESRRVGNRIGYLAASSMFALLDMRRGALNDADRDAIAAIDVGLEIGGNNAFLTAAWATYGDIGVDRGLPDVDLRARLAELEASEHDEDALPSGLVLHAKGRLAAALGDLDVAIDYLIATGRRENSWGATCPAVCPWRTSLALAYRDAGDLASARTLAEEEVGLARAFGAPRALGMALRAHALVGPPDAVTDGLLEALDVLERSSARLELARTLVDLGTELRRRGEATRAADLLGRGQELATRCGARGLAAVAFDEARAAGAEPEPLMATRAELLSPGERRVAEMVARGADERAIAQELLITERAVTDRLNAARRRLGVNGPDELVSALTETHPVGSPGPDPASAAPAPLDYAQAVREALRDFDLPHRLAASPLASAGASLDERAESVRALLREAAQGAFGEAPAETLMRNVLERGYFDPSASHEAAADELHVSRSTYYRRLREASERLAAYVEATARDGEGASRSAGS